MIAIYFLKKYRNQTAQISQVAQMRSPWIIPGIAKKAKNPKKPKYF
jgi:hypothetical protein